MITERMEFGGREYELADLEQIAFAPARYLASIAQRVGLDSIWPREGESDEQYELRLRFEAINGVDVPAVLAGYLVPAGTTWNATTAAEVRSRLELLTDPDEHARLFALAARLAPDFFGRTLAFIGGAGLQLAPQRTQ